LVSRAGLLTVAWWARQEEEEEAGAAEEEEEEMQIDDEDLEDEVGMPPPPTIPAPAPVSPLENTFILLPPWMGLDLDSWTLLLSGPLPALMI
jgi:hypothetical protein